MNRISKGLVCLLLSLPWPAAADRVLELEDDADGVVDGRVVLTSTLRLPSGTHLNCKGLRLVPSATGRPDVRGTAAKEYIPSVPEVGILVLRAEGVKIQDCKIGDVVAPFDFPVLVLDSKGPRSPNRILDNEIAGRYGGVMLIKSDRVHVIGNQVTFGIAAHGRGIGVYRDSDDNVVLHNTIVAHSIVNQTNFPLVPQAPTLADAANSRGIFSTALANGVLSFSFDGEPTQISLTEDMIDLAAAPTWLGTCDVPTGVCCEDRDDEKVCFGPPTDIAACRKDRDCGLTAENMTPAYLSERNLYQSNIIDFSPASEAAFGNPGLRTFGIVDIGSADDLIVGNTITRVDEGIHFGAAGHDFTVVVGPTGEELRNVNIGVTRVLVMGNTVGRTDDDELYGARSFGILAARGSMKVSLVGNTVTRSDTGIAIRQNAPNDTLVAGNFVHGNRFSFGLDQGFGVRAFSRTREYGATVTMNDFTGATKAAVSTGVCSNFQQVLHCVDPADCDNSCDDNHTPLDPDDDFCRRTGRLCHANAASCAPAPNIPVVGTCQLAVTRFSADLSDGEFGNHWDRTCEEGGFLPSDEPLTSDVRDCHPFGAPVAGAETPPAVCPSVCSR